MSNYPPAKPFKSFREQACLLVSRGMSSSTIAGKEALKDRIEQDLSHINYYRLSAYWYAYRKKEPNGDLTDAFKTKTFWETILGLYMFDRRLRTVIFDAISRIEIALRTQIAHQWAKYTGCSVPQQDPQHYHFLYTDPGIDKQAKKKKENEYLVFLDKVDKYYKKVNDDVARHHRQVYRMTSANSLPIWVFVEYTTFGNLAALLSRGLPRPVVSAIAKDFGFNDQRLFVSCINLLNDVRNTCAHQGRIWNRYWLTPKGAHYMKNPASSFPSWNDKYCNVCRQWRPHVEASQGALTRNNYQTAAVLTICSILLRTTAPRTLWRQRLKDFILNPSNPLQDMYWYLGFTNPHWHEHPLWN